MFNKISSFFSQPHQLFPFLDCQWLILFSHWHLLLYPCLPSSDFPATSLPLGITMTLKSHGFRATGAGLEIYILTCMAADPRQPYKPRMSSCYFLGLSDMASHLSSLSPYRWKEEKTCLLRGRRLKGDGSSPDLLQVFAHMSASQEGLLGHPIKPHPSLLLALASSLALCYFCFCWGLLQTSASHIFLCVFSGPPGRLAYPFIHRKLSLLWATRMLEKTNDMTSKIRNQDNGTVQKP